jgi:lantibiotic modifying enzyme
VINCFYQNRHQIIFGFPHHHEKPLAGVAHGSSGYALAFHEAYIITKNTVYLEIVKKSILLKILFDKETNIERQQGFRS